MDNKGKSMECPFTWDIDENLAKDFDTELEVFMNLEDHPVINLMNSVTLVFINIVKKNYQAALQKLNQAVKTLETINFKHLNKESISGIVLVHIIEATKYYCYKAATLHIKATHAYESIPTIDIDQTFNKSKISTLYGCKCLAWSIFHDTPKTNAIHFAKEAINHDPTCALWYFMLGKKLRDHRRAEFNSEPSEEELKNLTKAYELSKNIYFGVFLAHCYWEIGMQEEAKRMCVNFYNDNPTSVGIKLKLSRLFLQNKDYPLAKNCLDQVQDICPNNPMFLYYKGLYFEKLENYKLSTLYFKEATKIKMFSAELQYIISIVKLQPHFDIINHLNIMLKKYEKNKILIQQILLHLGMHHYLEKKDFKEALLCFLKAIEINPNNNQLKNYKNIILDYNTYNIFDFVKNKLIPEFKQFYHKRPGFMQNIVKKLEDLYIQNKNNNLFPNDLENMMI